MTEKPNFHSTENMDAMISSSSKRDLVRGLMGALWYRALDRPVLGCILDGILGLRGGILQKIAFDKHGLRSNLRHPIELADKLRATRVVIAYRRGDAYEVRNHLDLKGDNAERLMRSGFHGEIV